MIKTILKKSLLISAFWCGVNALVGFISLIVGLGDPGGYIKPVHPFWIFVFTYIFYLLASIIHLIFHRKTKASKWLSAFIGVSFIYALIIIPLILDDNYFESLDWRVPVFLFVQIALLVLFDSIVSKLFSEKKQ